MQITPKQKLIFFQIIGLISFVLLVISLCVHIITFWNINLEERFPYIFLLHVGIFVLIAPVLLLQKIEEKQEDEKIISLQNGFNETKVKKENLNEKSSIPKLLIIAYVLVGFYAVLNFMIFGFGAEGNPMIKGDKYVLDNHGHIVRELSKDEYDIASAQSLRGFSGHWIVFYFYFTSIAFLQLKNQREK